MIKDDVHLFIKEKLISNESSMKIEKSAFVKASQSLVRSLVRSVQNVFENKFQ
jgi:hypothetical protein